MEAGDQCIRNSLKEKQTYINTLSPYLTHLTIWTLPSSPYNRYGSNRWFETKAMVVIATRRTEEKGTLRR